MVLIIDNYDSFVYNIIHFLSLPDEEFSVVRNDHFRIEDLSSPEIESIIISPGPMSPREAGLSCEVIRKFYQKKPILGICLGHECIGSVFGCPIVQSEHIVHGESDTVYLENSPLYAGLPRQISAARYHSLQLDHTGIIPENLFVNATLEDGTIMGIEHRTAPLYGVQFHPESILTGENGKRILHNFLDISKAFKEKQRSNLR